MKKWQKILIICAICFSLALALGGFVTLGVLNYNPSVGGGVQLVYDGQHVYAQTEAAEGYRGYRFKFVGGGKEFTHDSASNSLNLSQVSQIELGKKYLISACYLGEIEGANSRYGKAYEWANASAYLARPEIKVEGGVLSWQKVENADYYVVKYGKNSQRTTSTSVNLSSLVGGKCDIAVTACYDFEQHDETEQSAKFKNSTSLTLVGVDVIHEFLPFKSVTLSLEGDLKILNITGNEAISKIDVIVGGQTFQFDVEKAKDFKLDITKIYKEDTLIGAKPSTVDSFNVYNGAITYPN